LKGFRTSLKTSFVRASTINWLCFRDHNGRRAEEAGDGAEESGTKEEDI
jgi:hypothetical protein